MATLLRLADADLRDAALLEAGRDPGNAPVLAGQAVTRMVHAVVATEVGWPVGAGDGDLDGVPDLNPLKRQLASLQQRLPSTTPPMPLRDGQAPPAPDHERLREHLLAARTLLKDLAERFQVDLRADGPAGRVVPLRPEPRPPPRPSPVPKPPERTMPKSSTPNQDVTSESLHRPQKPSVSKLPEGTIATPSPIQVVVLKPSRTFVATPPAPAPKADRVPAPVSRGEAAAAGRGSPARLSRTRSEGPSTMQPGARPGGVSSTVFWSLMDRWEVADADALRLVGHPGGLTKKGTRPRFKLGGDEIAAFLGLQEIDTALDALKLRPSSWLRQAVKEQPFGGTVPLGFLTREALPGIRATLRFLLRSGLSMSVTA